MLRTPLLPYQVVFSPQAWVYVGRMPHAAFTLLQQTIDRIARDDSTPSPSAGIVATRLRLETGLVDIIYERDDSRRILTVVDIVHVPSEAW
ncbi:hypothetical protein FJV41_32960 [Myxococcus llanfairpwllgwyngyllgogerychwyrndrobwllllantysiliogogogochensis]|uniref:Cytotoxic translational repressor of toxin-antitoxin stability system n=1 Tax=Myxococcus llanfairpwllgwyngyllgogerychwyrndrobwllllantysiliogogogochensis TaxID=2590453 RepID=A0A540WRR1_9BACT|nr:hypothetical protein FJV41_32960 [Myxococcus llanfairpwllgwyngyllgogerychwyrndrobwllllantysiliogogogochensis]